MSSPFIKAFRAGKDRVVFPESFELEDGKLYRESPGQHQHIVFDLGGSPKGNPPMRHPRTVCNLPFPEDNLVSQHAKDQDDQVRFPKCPECFGPNDVTVSRG